MAFVLVYRIRLRRPIIAAAVAAGMSASALIPSALAQSNPASPAEPPTSPACTDNAPGAAADCEKCKTDRAQAAYDANGPPPEPTVGAAENRKLALIILLFQNGANRPFGSFK